MLVGIVLRGAAFVFRSYDTERDALTLGGVVLVPSLFYLFRVFKFAPADAPRGL